MLTVRPRRPSRVLTPLATALLLVVSLVSVVLNSGGLLPGAARPAAGEPGEENGSTPSLRDTLSTALRDYNDAKGRLDASLVKQTELTEALRVTEAKLAILQAQVGTTAAAAYRGSKANTLITVLGGDSTQTVLHAAATVQYLARRDDRQLRELNFTKTAYTDQQAAIAAEVKLQQEQVVIMEKRKKEAEDALRRAGGGQLSTGFIPGKATAKPAARNSDGSWPRESCNVDDPTTTGCITARTLNAYNEARLAGYTRYTSCYRSGGSGEHPKGRACDFSSFPSGFLNKHAAGSDKVYGDRLAGWFIANASRLGVLYVIWYRQIWQPGIGWRSYSGSDPASAHTNHVHLSMQ